jgi:serine/threonine protein kinase
MRYLHAHTPDPVLHRDLKSLNVLITSTPMEERWVAKISDFGLATGGQGSGLTSTQTAAGARGGFTVSHSPPEVIDGGESTAAADV